MGFNSKTSEDLQTKKRQWFSANFVFYYIKKEAAILCFKHAPTMCSSNFALLFYFLFASYCRYKRIVYVLYYLAASLATNIFLHEIARQRNI